MKNVRVFAMVLLIILSMALLVACSGKSNPATTTLPTTITPGGPGGGAVINSDSVITGTIKAVRNQSTGYPWELDVLVQTSQNVGTLPNPTIDKIGQVVTMKTDQDIKAFSVGQSITAKVKYVGDVPLPGITLYIYNIVAPSGY